tara:strand:- start:327 stop:518 length:192 start_codon:yes stop_codon:yes gene_type:complete
MKEIKQNKVDFNLSDTIIILKRLLGDIMNKKKEKRDKNCYHKIIFENELLSKSIAYSNSKKIL